MVHLDQQRIAPAKPLDDERRDVPEVGHVAEADPFGLDDVADGSVGVVGHRKRAHAEWTDVDRAAFREGLAAVEGGRLAPEPAERLARRIGHEDGHAVPAGEHGRPLHVVGVRVRDKGGCDGAGIVSGGASAFRDLPRGEPRLEQDRHAARANERRIARAAASQDRDLHRPPRPPCDRTRRRPGPSPEARPSPRSERGRPAGRASGRCGRRGER